MRVLHVVASLAPRHGGPTVAALGLVKALRFQGVDASILSSDDDVGDVLDVPLHKWMVYEDVPVHFIPRVKAKQHMLVGFTFAPGFGSWLRGHARNYDFIHIHTVFSFPANVAMRVARKLHVPYAVRPMGHFCHWSLEQRSLVKKVQLALITRHNVNGAAFIHTTSRMEAAETAELGFASPCKVLPHGIDLPPTIVNARETLRVELGLPLDRMLLIFMSRFHEKKGIELLLEACSNLSAHTFNLILAGTGDERYVNSLKRRIADSKLDACVKWYGFATSERKWRLLQGGDIFVLPSRSENFGIAVLEALACGLPVIASDQVALGDEVAAESLGRLVPLDVKALTRALSQLMGATDERVSIRSRAIKLVREQFSWPAVARQVVAAYQECIGKARQST